MFTIKNISADKFSKILAKLGACDEAREFASGKDLRAALLECPDPEWIDWLIAEADGRFGMPAFYAYDAVVESAGDAYRVVVESAGDAYYAAVKPARDAYYAAVKALFVVED